VHLASAAATTSGRALRTTTPHPAAAKHLAIVGRIADRHRITHREPQAGAGAFAGQRLVDAG